MEDLKTHNVALNGEMAKVHEDLASSQVFIENLRIEMQDAIVCKENEQFNVTSRKCEAINIVCPVNYYFNILLKGCLPIPTCPANQHFNVTKQFC